VALLFPNVIFMDLMGLPVADAGQFQEWEVKILHGTVGGEESLAAMGDVSGTSPDCWPRGEPSRATT